tara:strand:- start:5430 stop:5699 length:270 start_codon:yes stop_codon:yes gene_type:complete
MTGFKEKYWHKYVDEVFDDNERSSREIADKTIDLLYKTADSISNRRHAPTQREVTSYLMRSPKYVKVPNRGKDGHILSGHKGCKWRKAR